MFCKQYSVYIILWYDKWIIFQPNNIGALFNKCLTIFTLGERTQAIFYFNKVLQDDPKYLEALYNKALSLSILSKYEEVISNFTKF